MSDALEFIDPNKRWGKKTVRLTFCVWGYVLTDDLKVGGNCLGLDNLTAAASQAAEKYHDTGIVLTNPEGHTLFVEDDEGRGDDWITDLIVSAEIVAFEPEPSQ